MFYAQLKFIYKRKMQLLYQAIRSICKKGITLVTLAHYIFMACTVWLDNWLNLEITSAETDNIEKVGKILELTFQNCT